jgi:hypothetical protein
MRSRLITGSVLLVLLLAVVSTCRQKSASTSTEVATQSDAPSALKPVSNASEPRPTGVAAHSTQRAGSVSRAAAKARPESIVVSLTADDPAAQINVRSQPTQTSDAIGYGEVGESVILGHTETDADGYTWYQVTFQRDDLVGWVREDLLALPTVDPTVEVEDTSAPVSAGQAPSDTLKTALDETCGSQQAIEAYYLTPSNTIYICKARNRRTYLSQETGTEQVVTAQDVEALGGGYIITNGNFEYRLDSGNFVVVRFDDSGQQEEVLRETIVYTERY